MSRVFCGIFLSILIIFVQALAYNIPVRAESILLENRVTFPEKEAKEWLKGINDISFLSGMSFKTKKSIERFIGRLYRVGALYIGAVVVMNEVCGFRIYLPVDIELRKEIFRLVNQELTGMKYPGEKDLGLDDVVIWFRNRGI